MKTPFFRKIVAFFVLIFFILSNFSLTPLYAEKEEKTQTEKTRDAPQEHGGKTVKTNQGERDHDLRDRFSGKELERVKTSVKGKNSYKLLIRSSDGLTGTENVFRTEDKDIQVRKVGDAAYIVELPLNNKSFGGELSKLDNGIIPSKLGAYDVVQPEVFETFATTGYLGGEATDKLWGMDRV